MLMGHDLKLDDAYDRPSFDFIVSEYQKATDALTIDPANRLRKKVEKLEVEKSKIDSLAYELEEIKKAIRTK
jgi:hypothetical protein